MSNYKPLEVKMWMVAHSVGTGEWVSAFVEADDIQIIWEPGVSIARFYLAGELVAHYTGVLFVRLAPTGA